MRLTWSDLRGHRRLQLQQVFRDLRRKGRPVTATISQRSHGADDRRRGYQHALPRRRVPVPPVLLLHGSGPGVSAWANWRLTIPALAPRTTGSSLRTSSASATPSGREMSTTRSRPGSTTSGRFLDALGIRQTSLVGNSLGGRIALDMAAQRPDRLHRMVLMGAPGVGMTITDGLRALREYEPSRGEHAPAAAQLLRGRPGDHHRRSGQDPVRGQCRAGRVRSLPGHVLQPPACRKRAGHHRGAGQAVPTRTLLVHGREDKVVPVEVAWNMVRLLPDADLPVFARCGHWTQIERADDFNDLVGELPRPGRPRAHLTLLETTMTMVGNHPDATVAPTRFPLVDDDADHHRFRVHRDTMTSPEIFREEAERIFNHSWLYVGHESEVAEPGGLRAAAGRRPAGLHGARRQVRRRCTSSTTPAPIAGPWSAGRSPATPRSSSASTTPGPSTPTASSPACRTGTPTARSCDFSQLGPQAGRPGGELPRVRVRQLRPATSPTW